MAPHRTASALALVSALTVARAATLTLELLSLTTYPLAVCNDGTPAGYHFKAGTNNVWM